MDSSSLDTMTRDQLVEQADALGVAVAKTMSKAAVRAAVEDALAAATPVTPPAEAPPVAPPAGGSPEHIVEPTPQLTFEQRRLLAAADDAALVEALADPAMPDWCRSEFMAEQARRADIASMRSTVEQWAVVKGGRYFIPGHGTTLPTGSVISAQTHNLDDVRAQGIEITPLVGEVEAYRDEMGFPKTRIVGG